jgi:hypothetical protein
MHECHIDIVPVQMVTTGVWKGEKRIKINANQMLFPLNDGPHLQFSFVLK